MGFQKAGVAWRALRLQSLDLLLLPIDSLAARIGQFRIMGRQVFRSRVGGRPEVFGMPCDHAFLRTCETDIGSAWPCFNMRAIVQGPRLGQAFRFQPKPQRFRKRPSRAGVQSLQKLRDQMQVFGFCNAAALDEIHRIRLLSSR